MDMNENLNPEEELTEQMSEDILKEEAQEEVHDEMLPEESLTEEPVMEEPAEPQQEAQEIPQQTKTTKRTSPYADSPYVMNFPVQETVKPKKVKKDKRSGGAWKRTLCAVLALVVLFGACAATGAVVNHYWEERVDAIEASLENRINELEQKIKKPTSGESVSGSPVSSVDGGLTPAQVYAKNVESVVLIYNEMTTQYNGKISTSTATGSGFILSEDGYVVTNQHVIDGNGSLTVVTYGGDEYPAKLVGADDTNDVALLKVEATGLPAVTLGSSDDLIVGDQVVAIGNPLGELTSTLTVGYISAKERDVNTDGFAINMLQTDAAINSGNSGGPLFNMRGEVIGITTAKYSGTSSSGASIEGVGFAIPIDDVSDLLSDLATYGYVTGAYLGVSVSDMDPAAANYYGMPVGAYVQTVEPGYAAQRAGMQPKDIILSIGGIRVETVNDLTRALRGFKAGDMTVIKVCRGGKELNLKVTLDEKPLIESEKPVLPEGSTTPEESQNWYDYLPPFFGGND